MKRSSPSSVCRERVHACTRCVTPTTASRHRLASLARDVTLGHAGRDARRQALHLDLYPWKLRQELTQRLPSRHSTTRVVVSMEPTDASSSCALASGYPAVSSGRDDAL